MALVASRRSRPGVKLRCQADQRDRHGRLIAKVFSRNGLGIGRRWPRRGWRTGGTQWTMSPPMDASQARHGGRLSRCPRFVKTPTALHSPANSGKIVGRPDPGPKCRKVAPCVGLPESASKGAWVSDRVCGVPGGPRRGLLVSVALVGREHQKKDPLAGHRSGTAIRGTQGDRSRRHNRRASDAAEGCSTGGNSASAATKSSSLKGIPCAARQPGRTRFARCRLLRCN
jgi:hypothetical protein